MTLLLIRSKPGVGSTGGGGPSSEVAAFLARTTGLDTTHTSAYTALIDGLVADGIWTKLDVLHVYATQDSTTALLNLVSTSYNGTANGSPTFTADRGFTNTASNSIYITTGFNATTAPSPKYIQNSAHLSAWSLTNVTSSEGIIGLNNGGASESYIKTKDGSNQAYFTANSSTNSGQVVGVSSSIGHYLSNRSNSTSVQGYINAVSKITTTTNNSAVTVNRVFTTLSVDDTTWGHSGANCQCAMASIGSSLNSTEVTNFYTRLRTYMTAVGVP